MRVMLTIHAGRIMLFKDFLPGEVDTGVRVHLMHRLKPWIDRLGQGLTKDEGGFGPLAVQLYNEIGSIEDLLIREEGISCCYGQIDFSSMQHKIQTESFKLSFECYTNSKGSS